MENNSSPYIYEKPINRNRTRRFSGLAALGLVGMVGIFGGSAIASTVMDNSPNVSTDPVILDAETAVPVSPETLIDPNLSVDPSLTPSVISEDDEVDDESEAIIAVPLQQAKPKPTSLNIELPARTATDWGNTSSATPYAGSLGSSDGNVTNYFTSKASEHEDDDHELETERHENEDHNESEDD